MGKLTKAQQKQHKQALDLIHSDKKLTYDEKVFCYENWNEATQMDINRLGAFHTPLSLAYDLMIDAGYGNNMLDLCAGTGILSFAAWHRFASWPYTGPEPYILCVEIVRDYVEIGKRLLPEAEWVCADALTYDVLSHIKERRFDVAYGNPPFGAINTTDWQGKYTGKNFDLKYVERVSQVAKSGAFIMPKSSVAFTYSGVQYYQRVDDNEHAKFREQTGISLEIGAGIDTSYYRDEWKNTKVTCEVGCADFEGEREMLDKSIRLINGDVSELKGSYANVCVVYGDYVTDDEWIEALPIVRECLGFNNAHVLMLDRRADVKKFLELYLPYKNLTVLAPFTKDASIAIACMQLGVRFLGNCTYNFDAITKEIKREYFLLHHPTKSRSNSSNRPERSET